MLKGPSINDVTPEGEGGGTPKRWQEVTRGGTPFSAEVTSPQSCYFTTKVTIIISILELFNNWWNKWHFERPILETFLEIVWWKNPQNSVICDFVTSNLRCILIPKGGGDLAWNDITWKGYSVKGDLGWQGEGGGSKNPKFGVTSFMDGHQAFGDPGLAFTS